jgi:hypothetical protein
MGDFDRDELQDGIERMRKDAAALRHNAMRSRELGRLKEQIERQRLEALSKRDQEEKVNMNNGTFDKDEFWAASGRLYNDTLAMKDLINGNLQSIIELRALAERDHQSIVELRAETGDLLQVARIHQDSLVKHEKRLDRTEVTVEAILEDLRRHRENRPPA